MTQKPKAKDPQLTMFAARRPPEIRTFDMYPGELVIDNFAGGGGVSEGTQRAIGRPVNIALNHDPEAIAMHAANHPETRHFCEDITKVNPLDVAAGRPIGLAWFAPDCTHHSKAAGKKPRDSKVRGLAQVVIDYAKLPLPMRPRIIRVENVEEFMKWGPLDEDGFPIKECEGEDFRAWLGALSDAGYKYEYRCLVAADYGCPTTRKRFFLIARRDGLPIIWPSQTHGDGHSEAWRGAYNIIDWSIPCRSIFGRKKPLKPATLKRIAMGLDRYVFKAADPFLIPVTHQGDARTYSLRDPLRTVTAANRGEFALIEPFIVRHGHYSTKTGAGLEPGKGAGLFRGQPLRLPIATVCATNDKHLVVPVITKHYGGANGHQTPGTPITAPLGAVTAKDHHSLTAAFLSKFYGTSTGADMRHPLPTVTGQGNHLAEVRAFLIKYYGTGGPADLADPLDTVTTKDRFGLVMVHGEPYQIVDIGMRMLKPRELFNGQDFPADYIIDPQYMGKTITQETQTRLAGNAVPPGLAEALVSADRQAA